MKRANKYLSLALALIMALSLCVTSFAADNGSITITNAKVGETYTLYKVFDATYAGSDKAAYTYSGTPETNEFLKAMLTGQNALVAELASTGVYNISVKEGAKDAEVLAFIALYVENMTQIGEPVVAVAPQDNAEAEEAPLTFSNLAHGYYYITTSLGSLVTVDNADPDVEVEEKNTDPSITKSVNKPTASIDEVVTFTLVVTDGNGTNKAITIHDTMDDGLTFVGNFKVNGAAVDTEKVTVTENGNDFTIVLSADYVAELQTGKTVTITYDAKLNENAQVVDPETQVVETNVNTAYITYSEQTYDEVTAEVKTFQFEINKVDEADKPLTGAKFKLYNAATGGTEIPVVLVEDGIYRVAKTGETGVEIAVDEEGIAVVKGIVNGTYYLEETQAPVGYNILTEREPVVIDNADAITLVKVENSTGAMLPSTGGVGTTMFYVLGSVMMIGAAVLLITKKKMANEQ